MAEKSSASMNDGQKIKSRGVNRIEIHAVGRHMQFSQSSRLSRTKKEFLM